MLTLTQDIIDRLRERLLGGGSITADEAYALSSDCDVHTLGELANIVRERLHGRRAHYNVNLHINYTNYCVLRCKVCSFYRQFSKGTGAAHAEPTSATPDDSGG